MKKLMKMESGTKDIQGPRSNTMTFDTTDPWIIKPQAGHRVRCTSEFGTSPCGCSGVCQA